MAIENKNNPWSKFYFNRSLIIVVALIISIFILLSGWNGWLNYFDETNKNWFQRSGSLMTATLLIADNYLYSLVADLKRSNMVGMDAIRVKDKYRGLIQIIKIFFIVLTLFATLIWGYGDIIYVEFHK